MIKKCVLISLLAMSACSLVAQPVAEKWPEFNCASNELVLTLVDLNICTKAGAYSNVQVLAGTTPSIVFEQSNDRFDVLSYEGADKALATQSRRRNKKPCWVYLVLMLTPHSRYSALDVTLRIFG